MTLHSLRTHEEMASPPLPANGIPATQFIIDADQILISFKIQWKKMRVNNHFFDVVADRERLFSGCRFSVRTVVGPAVFGLTGVNLCARGQLVYASVHRPFPSASLFQDIRRTLHPSFTGAHSRGACIRMLRGILTGWAVSIRNL